MIGTEKVKPLSPPRPISKIKMTSNFVIDPVKKNILTELVNSGKNTLLTGGTGCGKTTLAIEIAKELGLKPVVINCGSTQDARSSLLGYFTLKDGDTVFQEADFLKAIQEENTLIILDELSRASDDAYNIIFPILDFRQEVRVDEKDDERIVKVAKNVKFLDVIPLVSKFTIGEILDHVILSIFKQDSSSIITDANVLREYADSLGVYDKVNSATA